MHVDLAARNSNINNNCGSKDGFHGKWFPSANILGFPSSVRPQGELIMLIWLILWRISYLGGKRVNYLLLDELPCPSWLLKRYRSILWCPPPFLKAAFEKFSSSKGISSGVKMMVSVNTMLLIGKLWPNPRILAIWAFAIWLLWIQLVLWSLRGLLGKGKISCCVMFSEVSMAVMPQMTPLQWSRSRTPIFGCTLLRLGIRLVSFPFEPLVMVLMFRFGMIVGFGLICVCKTLLRMCRAIFLISRFVIWSIPMGVGILTGLALWSQWMLFLEFKL